MRVTPEEIQRIARLAHLALEPEETEKYATEFDDILAHFEVIDQYDLTGVEAFDPEKWGQISLRPDVAKKTQDMEDLYRNVKKRKDTFIEVPQILD